MKRKIFSAFFLMLCFTAIPAASAKTAYEILDEMPVQHEGRVKPFLSFAREVSLAVTGGERFQGMTASELVWRWIADPQTWASKPIIPVTFRPLQKELGMKVIKGRISPEVVLGTEHFIETVRAASAKQAQKEKLTALERKRLELYHDASIFQEITTGNMPGWVAHPEDPRAGWLPFQGFASAQNIEKLKNFFPEEGLKEAGVRGEALLAALSKDASSGEAASAAAAYRGSLNALFQSRGIIMDARVLGDELIYQRFKPFHWAWIFYLTAAGLWLLNFTFASRVSFFKAAGWAGLGFYAAGFLIHLYGFYLRCVIAGRPPVSNMYESIIWVSWAVAFFSLILFAFYRAFLIPFAASLVALIALLTAESFPAFLNPSITPLVPVLRSNLWLTIHVMTITLSYGAFALAWGIGHFVVFSFVFQPEKIERNRRLSFYLYRAVQIGIVLLASGTVLGGVWANYSWGRFWGWDPKETWALIALLGYLAVLHGRFAGWLGTFGTAVGCVVAFIGVVMAWYGVNFVLAAGLHSYGFGGGGAPYVLAVALADLAVIAAGAVMYRIKSKKMLQPA